MRIFRFRTLKFRPKIVTSARPHGKWGDVIVCLIPVSWCINIISNSNLILRMIEWQSESSLFTLRIRGRQWYWVYKYDFKAVTDLMTAPKNIGHNKWQISTPTELQTADDYLHVLQLRAHNKWVLRFWKDFLGKTLKEDNFNILSAVETSKIHFNKNRTGLNKPITAVSTLFTDEPITEPYCTIFNPLDYSIFKRKRGIFFNSVSNVLDNDANLIFWKKKKNFWKEFEKKAKWFWINSDEMFCNDGRQLKKFYKVFLNDTLKQLDPNSTMGYNRNEDYLTKAIHLYNHDNYTEVTRWTKRSQGTVSPCRLIKFPVDNQLELNTSKNTETIELLRLRFNEDHSALTHKTAPHNNFLIMKQKKYKPLKIVKSRAPCFRDEISGDRTNRTKFSKKMTLLNNSIFVEDSTNPTLKYKLIKKFKKHSENVPVTLWKRLLRTKRTLVLPAHVNVTVITNSYDVIHSWFIPGLGLKMDCVPGRATHHILHIDNVGFYYGQCAEICGRYHHHMPIRICALPFEHFLVWWHTFGLTKLMYAKTDQNRFTKTYALRKFVW
jgi:hypothetical protein